MATVYLADDLRHERKVALKVLKPELAAVVGAELVEFYTEFGADYWEPPVYTFAHVFFNAELRGNAGAGEGAKQMLTELELTNPNIRRSLLAALPNVNPSHLLDRKLFPGQPVLPAS